jgi:hypothetical protein
MIKTNINHEHIKVILFCSYFYSNHNEAQIKTVPAMSSSGKKWFSAAHIVLDFFHQRRGKTLAHYLLLI